MHLTFQKIKANVENECRLVNNMGMQAEWKLLCPLLYDYYISNFSC